MKRVLLRLIVFGCLVATRPAWADQLDSRLQPPKRALTQAPAELSGLWLWRTEGYGYVIQVVGDLLNAFEVTDLSCIPGFQARQVEQDGSRVVFQRVDDSSRLVFVGATGAADQGRLTYTNAESAMILHRVDSFPAVCDRTTADNPITTFDVFWETYREQYPFFHLHHVDWQATRDHFRPLVIHASPPELFGVLRAMIEPLHDHHTYIYSTSDTSLDYGGERPDPDPIGDAGRARALEIIQNRFLVVPLRSLANGKVSFGMLRDSIGYLRVMGFGAYYPDRSYERQGEDRFAADLRALDAALDTIFAPSARWRGLVIDMRFSAGGASALGLA
ncbi:MAG: hypothetical protein WAN70_06150, partial [Terriglobales bacterium]